MPEHGFFTKFLLKLANDGRMLLVANVANFSLVVLLFHLFEHVSFALSAYWVVVTAFTVGYGDIYAHSTPGHVLTGYVIVSSFFLLLVMVVAKFVTHFVVDQNAFTDEEQKEMQRSLKEGLDALKELTDNCFDDREQADLVARLERIEAAVQQQPDPQVQVKPERSTIKSTPIQWLRARRFKHVA